jgi:hypothetical protein
MGNELEPRETAELQPMYGPPGNGGFNGGSGSGFDSPEWFEPVPPYGSGDGFLNDVSRFWSYFIRIPRYLAIGFLWVTWTPWRFLYIVGTAGLFVAIIVHK